MTRTTKPPAVAVTTGADATMVRDVRDQLRLREDQLVALLGPTIPVERFLTVALHAVNSNRELLQCTPTSIVEAIREAAALRLEPTGLLGDAYLVRYGDQARLMPGYRGLMKLARRSGQIEKMDAQVVYDSDAFAIHLGTDPEIFHDPTIDGDRGNYTGAYAYARMVGGEIVVEWMSVADIEQVRKSSKAGNKGPWVSFWGEMARKTVLRRLMKRLPLDTVAEEALRLEAEAEDMAPQPPRGTRPPAVARIHERLGIESGAGGSEVGSPVDPPTEGSPPAAELDPAEGGLARTREVAADPKPREVATYEGVQIDMDDLPEMP